MQIATSHFIGADQIDQDDAAWAHISLTNPTKCVHARDTGSEEHGGVLHDRAVHDCRV
jgi:hypothetical protein